jgi:hypothetical protein
VTFFSILALKENLPFLVIQDLPIENEHRQTWGGFDPFGPVASGMNAAGGFRFHMFGAITVGQSRSKRLAGSRIVMMVQDPTGPAAAVLSR